MQLAMEERERMNQEAQRALGILDNAASAAPLTRADHVAVQRAVAVLSALVQRETGPLKPEGEPEAEAPAPAPA
jgi:hypothetical protein